jgi:phospholipase C
MGYYTRQDLPVHYGLADAFTVCDHYFSSVLGPTAPNRLYWITATLDPGGTAGGPVFGRSGVLRRAPLRWRTVPENLDAAGVSWKVYNSLSPSTESELTGMLRHFAQYGDTESALNRRGLQPRYPRDFVHDIAAGTLPAVSWIIPPIERSEHPAYPPAVGAEQIVALLAALTANPDIWQRTVLIVSYDENGGFFDHVAPPTPPPSEPGEYLDAGSGLEPIGLGFRVPCLVISPYTRGGWISSDVLDHTSPLRFVERRFGVPVPNLTAWRRRVVGDMTETFAPWTEPRTGTPAFPSAAGAAHEAAVSDRSVVASADHTRHTPAAIPDIRARQDSRPNRLRLRS